MRARSLAAEELLLLLDSVSRSRYLRFKAEQVAARYEVILAFFRIFSPGLWGQRSVPVSGFFFWSFYTDWNRTRTRTRVTRVIAVERCKRMAVSLR